MVRFMRLNTSDGKTIGLNVATVVYFEVFTAGSIVKVKLHLVDGSTVEIEDFQPVVSKLLKELTGLHGLSMWF
jgi:hypothetical protein